MNPNRRLRSLLPALCAVAFPAFSADPPPKATVPPSPYIPVIYKYADTMLASGRDTVGPQKTGLFLSALDRTTLAPLINRPPAPSGVRRQRRRQTAAPRDTVAGCLAGHGAFWRGSGRTRALL